eukprot:10870504-Lingulodinium_polyedra.AAC.1
MDHVSVSPRGDGVQPGVRRGALPRAAGGGRPGNQQVWHGLGVVTHVRYAPLPRGTAPVRVRFPEEWRHE